MGLPTKFSRADAYLDTLIKHRVAVNWGVLLTFLISVFLCSRLQLRPSFSELLPDNLPSVHGLLEAQKRIGGTGVLFIGVESPSFEANKKFVEALSAKLKALPKEEVRLLEYNYTPTIHFFEKYALHYLDETQLTELKDQIEHEIDKHKSTAVSSFLGLNDDEESEPVDRRALLPKQFDLGLLRMLEYREGYIASDDGRLLIIRLLPTSSSLSISQAEKLTHKIQGFINELDPTSYDAKMTTGFAGNVQRTIEESEAIKADIVDTALLLVVLILIVLFAFFWSPRWIALLVAALCVGVAWTLGLTQAFIGYLNTQTAFLGSLVAGTGVNYGIILLARYIEERRHGKEVKPALVTAIEGTSIGTLLGSSTTALSFSCLLIADNKGLSQFGFIGCIGILLCWIATFVALPVWIYQLEMNFPFKSYRHPFSEKMARVTKAFGDIIVEGAPFVGGLLIFSSIAGVYGINKLLKDPMEYDFSKLQNKISAEKGSTRLNNRIRDEVMKSSHSINVVLMRSKEEAKELCPAVRKIVDALPPEKRVFESCVTLWDLLPRTTPLHQTAHAKALRQDILRLFGNRLLKFSDDRVSSLAARLREHASPLPPSESDLPEQLVQRFTEKDGSIGLFGAITPDRNKALDDARNLFNYTSAFKEIELPESGTTVNVAGDPWVIADLLKTIQHDGPLISIAAFVGVVMLTFLLTGSVKGGLLMGVCLAFATWWQISIQGLMGIKFNFFNFIALPITFGIGIDYPINVYLRARETHFRSFGDVLATTGAAVILCSLTTTISYYTLFGASNQALVTFAHLAMVGEFTCIAGAIFLLPVVLTVVGKYKRPQDA